MQHNRPQETNGNYGKRRPAGECMNTPTCEKCKDWNETTDLNQPHTVRTCPQCGRKVPLRNLGPHGIGIKVQKGDQFVLPANFLQVSANPLRGTGILSEHGINWFAQLVFGIDISNPERKTDFAAALSGIIEASEEFFRNAEVLKGINLADPANEQLVFSKLSENQTSVEWWGYLAAAFSTMAQKSIGENNANDAAWAMAVSERFRSLAIFKTHFADAVFVGQSARRLLNLLKIWDANKHNKDEGFWQIQIKEHSFALSQAFSMPVTFIQDNAYVGGMQIDKKDARLLDFLAAGGTGNDAILIEIKTPMTPLLGRQYRGNAFSPSPELGGAIVQVLDYRESIHSNLDSLIRQRQIEVQAFHPKCLVIAGNYKEQITNEKKKRSFELFRNDLLNVEILTFDEFFRKIEELAKLFNIVRQSS
jgi:hypothetical protein